MNDTQTALMIRDDHARLASYTEEAIELRDLALGTSSLIGRVSTPSEQEAAVAAQTKLQFILSEAEKARKAVKEPVLAFGQLIDTRAREFKEEISEELLRLARLIGDYQALEQAKARAAEQLKREELAHIERDKLVAASQAKTHEELDAINHHFNDKAAILTTAPVFEAPRAAGQRVVPDWEITVSDVWLLAQSHPTCVTIQPRMTEIKALLNAGATVAGVVSKRITKSGVRLKPTSRPIDV